MKEFIKKQLRESLTKRQIKGEYFYKILNELFGNKLNKEFIQNNQQTIEQTLIERAKYNLDSKPSNEKINQWKQQIKEILDFYLNDKFDIEDADDIKKYNTSIFNKLSAEPKIKDYIFGANGLVGDIYHELGYKNVQKYIEKEKNTTIGFDSNFQKALFKHLKFSPNNDEQDKRLKGDLLYFFLRRVVANIPSDKKIDFSEDSLLNWLKTYTYKFIYEYANKFKDV